MGILYSFLVSVTITAVIMNFVLIGALIYHDRKHVGV